MIREIQGNLFDAPRGSALVQCISADGKMPRGISVQFLKRFPSPKWKKLQLGSAVPIETKGTLIYNLITKERFFEKPKAKVLAECLQGVKDQAQAKGIYFISMPLLGCGLDRLNYSRDLKPILLEIFSGTEYCVMVLVQDVISFRYV